jgi:plasmid maintenance system antidote protein VapI
MPLKVIHPGNHLAGELTELGMRPAELARRLDVPTSRVASM